VLAQITDAGVAIDAFQDTFDITSTGSYTTFTGTTRSNTAAASAWDGYEVEYDANLNASGMPDAVTWFITAIEVIVNYDVTATLTHPEWEQPVNQPVRTKLGVVASGPRAGGMR
jgi:hypothetical protein